MFLCILDFFLTLYLDRLGALVRHNWLGFPYLMAGVQPTSCSLSLSLSVSFSLARSLSISLYPWSIFSRPPSLHALSFSSNSTCFHLFFSSYSRHRDTHFHEPSLHRHYLPCDAALYCFHRYCTGEKIKGEIALTLKPASWVQVCVVYMCVCGCAPISTHFKSKIKQTLFFISRIGSNWRGAHLETRKKGCKNVK